ncbi:MAG: hypothetical protein R2800_00070 [Flavipsychrobacter sp.]
MNVAKYIGLFLLKHNKCYVNGLGTLELKSKPATYDGESLHAPIKEILLSTNGNIDESLSNFIATNEQISISKATKALNEFSEKAKQEIAAGNTVAIPALGKLAEESGKAYFITAPQLQFRPPAIKAPKSPAKRPETTIGGFTLPQQTPIPQPVTPGYQQQTSHIPDAPSLEEEEPKLNWVRIVLVALIVILLAAAGFLGWQFYNQMNGNKASTTPPPTPTEELLNQTLPEEETLPVVSPVDTTTSDSTATNEAEPEEEVVEESTSMIEATPVTLKLKVILNTYDSKERAHKRYRQLKSYGNNVEIIKEDTNYYFVAMPISASPSDTSRILDSLSRNFNPSGVFIY